MTLYDWLSANPAFQWLLAAIVLFAFLMVLTFTGIIAVQLVRHKGSKKISILGVNVEWKGHAQRAPKQGFRLFFSTPVRGLSEERRAEFFSLMDSLLNRIESFPFDWRVYYSSRGQRTLEEFDKELKTSTDYFAEIDRSDAFIAIIPRGYRVEGYVSGVYFEAGYAMARGKPSIYFVPKLDGAALPQRMRDAGLIQGVDVTVMQYESPEQVVACICSKFAPSPGDSQTGC